MLFLLVDMEYFVQLKEWTANTRIIAINNWEGHSLTMYHFVYCFSSKYFKERKNLPEVLIVSQKKKLLNLNGDKSYCTL